MQSSRSRGPLRPETRTDLFYLSFFTIAGVMTAYGGLWFAHMGLSEAQISLISAAPILVMLMLNIAVGRIADRASDWRQVIIWGAMIGGLSGIGLIWAQGVWSIGLVILLVSATQIGTMPVLDAATIRMTRRRGSSYGPRRAWGTVGYILALVLTGVLADRYGPAVFVPLFVGIGLLRAATSLLLPRFRAPEDPRDPVPVQSLRAVLKPWFVLPLLGAALVFGSHLILNTFQSLLLVRQGISETTVSLLIALGAVAETVLFFTFARFSHLLAARQFLLIAALVTVLRWVAFGFEPGVGPLIFLQALHAITFALSLIAVVGFIANHTDEGIAAQAQSFYVMLQQGASILALMVFGSLVGSWGGEAYFLSAGIAALGAACILASLVLKPPREKSD